MKRLLIAQLALCCFALPAIAAAQATATAIAKNGPNADKIVLAIIGDGYASGDMATYRDDVDRLVMDDLFYEDPTLVANRSAFNIYRVDVESNDSGVSEWFYKLKPGGDSSNAADWELDPNQTQITNDTALGYVANGVWAKCWHEYVISSADTSARIQNVLNEAGLAPDKVIVVLNTSRLVGCAGGSRLVVNSGTHSGVVAHELGHMVPGLSDEYWVSGKTWSGGYHNHKNCSTVLNQSSVYWSDLLAPGVDLPTIYDATTMDPDDYVGMFEGCRYAEFGIYRPVHNCRMRGSGEFCPVCEREWSTSTAPYRDSYADYMAVANYPGALCKGAYAQLAYNTYAHVQNPWTVSRWAVCPAKRVHLNGLFSTYFFGFAWVKDRHPDQDVCCRVRTRNPGGAIRDGVESCSEASSAGYQMLRLDFPKVNDPYTWSHVEVLCKLPPVHNNIRSEILTYRVGQDRF